jgi:LSD1 subclass zinc finger protein
VNRCEICGEPAETPQYLCRSCERQTGEELAAFPGLYRDLAAFLPRSTSVGGGGSRGTVSHSPLPLVEEPLVLRGPGGIVGVLEDWQAALHADRGWTAPVLAGDTEARIRAAVTALYRSLRWIATDWPEAGQFAREINDLHRGVTSITAPPERKGVRMGNCPAIWDGVLCGAVLHLPRGETVIKCSYCEASWAEPLWMMLRGWQDEMQAAS